MLKEIGFNIEIETLDGLTTVRNNELREESVI